MIWIDTEGSEVHAALAVTEQVDGSSCSSKQTELEGAGVCRAVYAGVGGRIFGAGGGGGGRFLLGFRAQQPNQTP